ncbi:MAG: D-alanine--D-alanine ligase [Elusimicrobiota bacterium]|jgi:D-alanine-D-alanine ligase|nr:D-alanine--D-alanine ligase [Elusimicrobiota bacterium]
MNIEKIKKQKIGVLYGGSSTEREVSLKSGKAVFNSLKKMKFNVCLIDIKNNAAKKISQAKIDIAFPVLHGRGGEDGAIQGFLETINLPYIGCGIFASAASMDKNITKQILASADIKTPKWICLTKGDPIKKISYPVVVKPVNGGSTVGISICKNQKELDAALETAFKYDTEAIIEQFIKGTEITVAVLNGKTLPIIEIIAESGFYDFEAKYKKGASRHIIPARISAAAAKTANNYAKKIYEVFNCRPICRADMIVDKKNNVWVLENNTSPGLTETSLVPDAARACGISFDDLMIKLLESL